MLITEGVKNLMTEDGDSWPKDKPITPSVPPPVGNPEQLVEDTSKILAPLPVIDYAPENTVTQTRMPIGGVSLSQFMNEGVTRQPEPYRDPKAVVRISDERGIGLGEAIDYYDLQRQSDSLGEDYSPVNVGRSVKQFMSRTGKGLFNSMSGVVNEQEANFGYDKATQDAVNKRTEQFLKDNPEPNGFAKKIAYSQAYQKFRTESNIEIRRDLLQPVDVRPDDLKEYGDVTPKYKGAFNLDAPNGVGDTVADTISGLAGFIGRMGIIKSQFPTLHPAMQWELASDRPGNGQSAIMWGIFGASAKVAGGITKSMPKSAFIGRGAITVGAPSLTMGGLTAIPQAMSEEGINPVDVGVQMGVGLIFGGLELRGGKLANGPDLADRIIKNTDIPASVADIITKRAESVGNPDIPNSQNIVNTASRIINDIQQVKANRVLEFPIVAVGAQPGIIISPEGAQYHPDLRMRNPNQRLLPAAGSTESMKWGQQEPSGESGQPTQLSPTQESARNAAYVSVRLLDKRPTYDELLDRVADGDNSAVDLIQAGEYKGGRPLTIPMEINIANGRFVNPDGMAEQLMKSQDISKPDAKTIIDNAETAIKPEKTDIENKAAVADSVIKGIQDVKKNPPEDTGGATAKLPKEPKPPIDPEEAEHLAIGKRLRTIANPDEPPATIESKAVSSPVASETIETGIMAGGKAPETPTGGAELTPYTTKKDGTVVDWQSRVFNSKEDAIKWRNERFENPERDTSLDSIKQDGVEEWRVVTKRPELLKSTGTGEAATKPEQGIKAYHGSPIAGLDEINFGKGVRSKPMMGTTTESESGAIFFTPDPETARFFANNRTEALKDKGATGEPTVYERMLDIKKPIDLTNAEKADEALTKAGIDVGKEIGNYADSPSDLLTLMQTDAVELSDLWKLLDKKNVVEQLKKAGYDGAIIKETGDRGTSYAIFDPKQARKIQSSPAVSSESQAGEANPVTSVKEDATPQSKTPVDKMTDNMIESGFVLEAPRKGDTLEVNEKALVIGGYRYQTFISGDGKVRIAVDSAPIFENKGRVFMGDSKSSSPTQITIQGIVVDPSARKQGLATKAMKQLHDAADKAGVTLVSEPVTMGDFVKKGQSKLTTNQLIKWYKKLGWTQQTEGSDLILERKSSPPPAEKQALPETGKTERIANFTPSETINRDYAKLKEKLGEKKARRYFTQVDKLINPNKNEVIEYRENGVVTKEGEKYIFNALSDVDMKNWRVSAKTDVTDQFVADAALAKTEQPPAKAGEGVKTEIERQDLPTVYNDNNGKGYSEVSAKIKTAELNKERPGRNWAIEEYQQDHNLKQGAIMRWRVIGDLKSQTELPKEIVNEEAIIEPPTSPKVDAGQADGITAKPEIKPTGTLDPTNPKDAAELVKQHEQWVAGSSNYNLRSAWEGINAKDSKGNTTSVEYTPAQIDQAYRTIEKPVESPMPDTKLFALPGKEKELSAIAAKMAKVKGTGLKIPAYQEPKSLGTPKGLAKVGKNISDHIKALYKASSTESTRYAINGVNVKGDELTATDGRRLFIAKGKWGKDGIYLNAELLKKGELGKPEKEGKFPNYEDIVPDTNPEDRVIIDNAPNSDMLETVHQRLRQAAVLTNEESKGVMVIKNKDGTLGFASVTPEQGHAEINVLQGGKILGAVNPQFLMDALNFHAIRGDKYLEFYFPAPDRPIYIKGDGGKTKSIIMPVNPGETPMELSETLNPTWRTSRTRTPEIDKLAESDYRLAKSNIRVAQKELEKSKAQSDYSEQRDYKDAQNDIAENQKDIEGIEEYRSKPQTQPELSPEQQRGMRKGSAIVLGPEDFADAVKFGKYLLKKLDNFADWSAKMEEDLGSGIKPELPRIWGAMGRKEEARPESQVKPTENPAPLTAEDMIVAGKELGEIRNSASANERINEELDALGLNKISSPETQHVRDLQKKAIDEGVVVNAPDIAARVLAEKDISSWTGIDVISQGLNIYKARLQGELKDVLRRQRSATDETEKLSLNTEANRLRSELSIAVDAYVKTKTEAARALQAASKDIKDENDEIMNMKEAEINKGNPLDAKEKAAVKEYVGKIDDLEIKLDEAIKNQSKQVAQKSVFDTVARKYANKTIEWKDNELKNLVGKARELIKAGC